ncbi:polysaccharide pyruvyl transferase family protein [Galbitalea soli]|uniref:Polysaccharide pyruvyl transferase family protein n=1 Tax=Galbitalea soli TaxID=1268042 RepID=A0A7C9PP00_9MICO|nr:polysaccharide pyruvyl transferase family protein [Galbitalea soli]NYJ29356.1 polysaccharide pyruvyl transferase WcaK-like protein [Galbitalea soli]
MRVLTIGDVGVVDGMVHLGDEAMFEAFVDAMRERRDARITGISAAPAETSARYGIDAIAGIGFGGALAHDRAAQADRMSRVLRTADGTLGLLDAGDPAHRVIEAVRASDAVAVSGGGNMASTWPLHIFERATLAELAHRLDRPFVVSGQTLGPELTGADRELLGGLLRRARLVGLREEPSLRLARALGVAEDRSSHTLDDASFLRAADSFGEPASGILVSLSTHLGGADRERAVTAIAALIDRAAELTGLDVGFLAHFASVRSDAVRGDSVLHEEVRARMTAPSVIRHVTHARPAADLARAASLVVTSRYHPAVFALSGAVPTLALPVDEYTSVKLAGALGNLGQNGVLPLHELLASGASTATLDRVVAEAETIRADGLARLPEARRAAGAWWDRVAAALGD